MRVENALSTRLERYLDLATTQTRLTAENMANIDTPGYRAVGMDFETEMRTALGDAAEGRPSRPVQVQAKEGLIARPDGNNVSIDRESLNLAEAQLKFKTGVALLRTQYQMTMDAIHADK
jgi:flagellar basal-body rod protein FlgB